MPLQEYQILHIKILLQILPSTLYDNCKEDFQKYQLYHQNTKEVYRHFGSSIIS